MENRGATILTCLYVRVLGNCSKKLGNYALPGCVATMPVEFPFTRSLTIDGQMLKDDAFIKFVVYYFGNPFKIRHLFCFKVLLQTTTGRTSTRTLILPKVNTNSTNSCAILRRISWLVCALARTYAMPRTMTSFLGLNAGRYLTKATHEIACYNSPR